jgi:hypothetical protein
MASPPAPLIVVDYLLRFRSVGACQDRDLCALFSEQQGGGFADALRSARNERNFSG